MERAFAAFLLCAAACSSTSPSVCASGRVCPSGSICVDEANVCAAPDQVDACRGLDDGQVCLFDGLPGQCLRAACIPDACGDGRKSPSEDCDPNAALEDTCESLGFNPGQLACSARCTLITTGCDGKCGDGVVNQSEPCDDSAPEVACAFGSATCTADCRADVRECVRVGWSPSQAGTEDLVAVSVVTRSLAFALSSDQVLRFDGVRWTVLPPPPDELAPLVAVAARSEADVWVASSTGLVGHFDGTRWDLTLGANVGQARAIAISDRGLVIAGTTGSALLSDRQWRQLVLPGTDVAGAGAGVYLASTSGVHRLGPAGWETLGGGSFERVGASDDGTVVAARGLEDGRVRVGWLDDGLWRQQELRLGSAPGTRATGLGVNVWQRGALVVSDRGVFHLGEQGWLEIAETVSVNAVAGSGPGFTLGVGANGRVWTYDGLSVVSHAFEALLSDDIYSGFEGLHARTRRDVVFSRVGDDGTRYRRRVDGQWKQSDLAAELGRHLVVWAREATYAAVSERRDASALTFFDDQGFEAPISLASCCATRAVGTRRGQLFLFGPDGARSQAADWRQVSPVSFAGGCAFDNGDAMLFGDDGNVLFRQGVAESVPLPLGELISDVECWSDGTVTAVGPLSATANMFRLVDGAWQPEQGPNAGSLRTLAASGPDDVFAASLGKESNAATALWHRDDNQWSQVLLPEGALVRDVEVGASPHDVFVSAETLAGALPYLIIEITRVRPWSANALPRR